MKKRKLKSIYLIIMLVIVICTMTVAFSALSTELKIAGKANFRVVADIRIIGIELVEATNDAKIEYDAQYNTTELITGLSLPQLNSAITYKITVNNIGNVEMKLKEIVENSMSNDNIIYEIEGIQVNDIIGASNTTKTFLVTFKYKDGIDKVPNDIILNGRIAFNFIEITEIKVGDYVYVDPSYNLKTQNEQVSEADTIKQMLDVKWKIHTINEDGTYNLISETSEENSEYAGLIISLGTDFKIESCEGENSSTNMHILVKK